MERVPFGKFGFIHKSTSDWIREHTTIVITVGTLIVCALSWSLYQWKSGSTGDYIVAENVFNAWTGGRNDKLLQLQKILKHHPELHAKYDGRIAQKLLLSSEQGLSVSFVRAAQKRVGELSPYHTQFTNCSLLIGEKKFDEALIQASELNKALQQDEHYHESILYGYNLLRIAFLKQMTGDRLGELAAWNEFKQEADSEAFRLICQNFQKNDVSLTDFIQYRETALK